MMNMNTDRSHCPYLVIGQQECGKPVDGGKSGPQRAYLLYCAEHALVILMRIARGRS